MRVRNLAMAVTPGAHSRISYTCSVAAAVALALAHAGVAPAETPESGTESEASTSGRVPHFIRLAQADKAGKIRFNIPQQPLSSALAEWSRQSGLQVLGRDSDDVTEIIAPAVSGLYSPGEALERMLATSGLKHEFINDRTVRVSAPEPPAHTSHAGRVNATALRLAQGDTHATRIGNAFEGSTGRSEDAAGNPLLPGTEGAPSGVWRIEEIVVTGTHISGTELLPAPSTVITREDLLRSGDATVQAVFEKLPQNFNQISTGGLFASEGGSRLAQQNFELVSAIDLRGLGPESTLTLVNGARWAGSLDGRVVDISAIPLSAIERIEIVTGGRSAVYGSDAVAGVVNLVTRSDFQGLETTAYYGWSESGGERFQVSQAGGFKRDRAGVVVAYDYQRDEELDLVDAGLVVSPALFGQSPLKVDAQPHAIRQSAFVSGRFALNDSVELTANGLYTHKNTHALNLTRWPGASSDSYQRIDNRTDQFGASVTARINTGRAWVFNVSSAASRVEGKRSVEQFSDFGFFSDLVVAPFDNKATLAGISVVADGPLPSIADVTPRAAIGAEGRREEFERSSASTGINDSSRTIRSVFGEVLIPLAGSLAPGRRLDVSVAARYDDYSDFGGTFNAQGGVVWQPLPSVVLRGSYASAFRAPALVDLGTQMGASLSTYSDPTAADGSATVLQWNGDNPRLGPEKADTWSVSLDLTPTTAPWAELSLTYT